MRRCCKYEQHHLQVDYAPRAQAFKILYIPHGSPSHRSSAHHPAAHRRVQRRLMAPSSEPQLLHIEDSDGTQRAPTRFTTGAVVSSLHILKDPENGQRRGGFFVFPDLGVRAEGKYRLKCTLYEVVDSELVYRNHIFSSVFEVYQSRKFPGMQKSTPLSCSFSEQGIKIWIRKNVRERRVPALDRSPRIVEAQVPKPPRKRARVDQEEDVKKKTERIDKSERHTPMLESPSVLYVAPPTPSISDTFPLPPGYAAPPSPHQHRRDQAQGRSRMSIGNLLNAADPPRLESR
ncbi:velvet factor-domain-containing protein [Mucidula mucida]|nr:velvet factor-domain-containing protein [Mucidula mucida]